MKTFEYNILKTFVLQRNLSVQYIDLVDRYLVFAFDGSLSIDSIVSKDGGIDQSDFEMNLKPKGNCSLNSSSPFSSKSVGGKKLYRRKHGVGSICQPITGVPFTDIPLVVPYNFCKIDKIEIVGCELGDKVNFKVYDNTEGIVQQSMGMPLASIVPNRLLNQFGFDVNVPKDFYEDHSQYDADLYKGMIVEVEYINNGNVSKFIGVNYTLHEMK